jgi:hypothetical protein
LKIELPKPVYFFGYDKHAQLGQPYIYQEGIEVYAFKPVRGEKKAVIARETVPVSNVQDNTHLEISVVHIDKDFENIELDREYKLSGISRYDYYKTILVWEDYANPELARYDRTPKEEVTRNKQKMAENERRKQELVDQIREKRFERLKEDFASDNLDVKSINDFELISDGRFYDNHVFNFKVKATVENLLKKVGNNYVFEIGKLIGQQIELDAEDMTRHFDIYQPYLRALDNEIRFTIPDGYKVDDISGLNMKVDNESASFIVTAALEGNQLILKTSKSYKKQFDKKENWNNYTNVLEKAFECYQKKIVLKKV